MATESTTGLYRSIHAQPQAVRELLADWDGPSKAAEKLSQAGRIFVSGILTPGQYVRLNLCITPGHCDLTMV